MPAITSLGIGSGLDINSMVTQLVALEKRPLSLMQTEATRLQTQVSSYGKISSLFSNLQSASNKLTAASLWAQSTASSGDETAVSVSGGSGAPAGNYAVSVQKLAGAQTLASATSVPTASDLVGGGILTIDSGNWEDRPPITFVPRLSGTPIIIENTDTLQTLRDKINAAGTGVNASIVTDSSGARLALRSSATGAENGFRVTVNDDDADPGDGAGLSRFAYDPEDAAIVGGMSLKQAAQNAEATINGIAVSSASNELDTVVEGLTLRLRKQTTGDVDVAVSADREGVKTAVKAFADAYNELAKTIADQTKYDATSKVGGPLQGDSAATGLQQQLRALINAPSGASSSFQRLSDIGLEMQRDGTLSVNATKLDSAASNLTELKKAFGNLDSGNAANNGFARRYADLATQVLGVDGSLTTRTEGLRTRLTLNSTEQEKLNDRVDRYQQRLVAQYTAMDANLSRLNSLSSYLTQQLASLTSSSSDNSN